MLAFSVDVDFSFIYDYDLELRSNGKRYFRLTNSTLPYKVGGVYIHLENLFNGDKLLGRYQQYFKIQYSYRIPDLISTQLQDMTVKTAANCEVTCVNRRLRSIFCIRLFYFFFYELANRLTRQ